MLGVKSVHNPITGAVADDIRATLIRMQTALHPQGRLDV